MDESAYLVIQIMIHHFEMMTDESWFLDHDSIKIQTFISNLFFLLQNYYIMIQIWLNQIAWGTTW